MPEIVYVLTNEAMPGYVKVGRTSSGLDARVRDLSSRTAVPLPFTVHYARQVDDSAFVERKLHEAFDGYRITRGREFFRMYPEQVVAALLLAPGEDITTEEQQVDDTYDPEDRVALEKARQRRGRFSFSAAGVPLDAEIVYSRDPSVTAAVVADSGSESIEFSWTAHQSLQGRPRCTRLRTSAIRHPVLEV